MENLGKLSAIAVCVCLASLNAKAEFQPLDELTMSGVTGQAGLSIEINRAEMTIGEIRYEDQGSIAIRDVRLGGANKTEFFGNQWIPSYAQSDQIDNVKIDIDVMSDGDLVAIMKPAGTFSLVDFSLTTGDWLLMDSALNDGTTLISNLSIVGVGIDARLRIDNQTAHTFVETTFGVDDLDVDIPFMAVGIRNAQIAGSNYLETIGLWGSSGAGVTDIGAEVDFELYGSSAGLGFNLNKFQMDVVMPEIYLGDNPSIGALTFNNVDITAQTVIYGH